MDTSPLQTVNAAPQPPLTDSSEILIPVRFKTSDPHNTLFLAIDLDCPPTEGALLTKIMDLVDTLFSARRHMPQLHHLIAEYANKIKPDNVMFVWCFGCVGEQQDKNAKYMGPASGSTLVSELDGEGLQVCFEAFAARGSRDYIFVDVDTQAIMV